MKLNSILITLCLNLLVTSAKLNKHYRQIRRKYIVRCCGGESCQSPIATEVATSSLTKSTDDIVATDEDETSIITDVTSPSSNSFITMIVTTTSNPISSSESSSTTSSSITSTSTTSTSTTSTSTTSTSTTSMLTTMTSTTTTTTTNTITPTTTPQYCDSACPKNCNCKVNLLDLEATANFTDYNGEIKFICGVPLNMTFSKYDLPHINTTAYGLRQDYFCCSSCVVFQNKSLQNRVKRASNIAYDKKCVQNLYNVHMSYENVSTKIRFDVMEETQNCGLLYGQNLTISLENIITCTSSLYMFDDRRRVPACSKLQQIIGCSQNILIPLQSFLQFSDAFCIFYQHNLCQPFLYNCYKSSIIRWQNEYPSCILSDIGDGRLYYFMLNDKEATGQVNASNICKSKCGMTLAVITSDEQNTKIINYIYPLIAGNNYWASLSNFTWLDLWLALESNDQGMIWTWPGNIMPTYFNWYSSEPTKKFTHLCAYMTNLKDKWPAMHGKWQDLDYNPLSCNYPLAYMCST